MIVLLLDDGSFSRQQRQRAVVKKPTVLPRWVFSLLTLNWLAPALN
jgi:hypothetical protein